MAATCALVLALGGLASGKLKERSVSFQAEGFGEGTASCKRGQEAVAGGFFVNLADGPSATFLFDSLREGKRDWRLHLYGFSLGGDPVQATAYAYCDKKKPGLKVVTATGETDEDGVGVATARCPRGKEAVAGGFDAPETELLITRSKRVGKRRWEVGFLSGPGIETTAVALCDKHEPELKTKQKTTTLADDETKSIAAKCKRTQELRSGGFEAEYDITTGDPGSSIVGSRRQGKRRWEATSVAFNGTPELVAYAYCDKKEGA
jgi:hypothetical protein